MSPRFFSRVATVAKTKDSLPHWDQSGCACFVTWRTADSIPQSRLAEIRAEREAFDLAHPQPWDESVWQEHSRLFEGRYQRWLDEGAGACVLRKAEVRLAVERTIFRFNRIRYVIYACVVMPNHVHVLFMPFKGVEIPSLLKAWKGVSAREINRLTENDGSFWQGESWDHLVRSAKQFDRYRAYIRANDPALAYDAYREQEEDKGCLP